MPDIQSAHDHRDISIQRVGVKGVRHPFLVDDIRLPEQVTTGELSLYVGLASDRKGAHMSRFFELLGTSPLSVGPHKMHAALDDMMTRLESSSAEIDAHFSVFLPKKAPVSGVESLMDYQVRIQAACRDNQLKSQLTVTVPVTSLCPCSKAIAEYGAHNQRSHIVIDLRYEADAQLSILTPIEIAEAQASCELYGLLKRPDEKFVTEKAYDNPKFVEDLVRDVATALADLKGVSAFRISSENFESIHNHSAYAQITHQWD
ncbi:MAG: GTP cyclohydrolase I FolE2 [Legionellales bacterium]|nr:GTP cyclohydrolase I FolE2 [Legionellales bacterium]|tara:strand:+ start:1303 stop:2082 length:780 start_codon:yes stop_codon:yes gene_type:complete